MPLPSSASRLKSTATDIDVNDFHFVHPPAEVAPSFRAQCHDSGCYQCANDSAKYKEQKEQKEKALSTPLLDYYRRNFYSSPKAAAKVRPKADVHGINFFCSEPSLLRRKRLRILERRSTRLMNAKQPCVALVERQTHYAMLIKTLAMKPPQSSMRSFPTVFSKGPGPLDVLPSESE